MKKTFFAAILTVFVSFVCGAWWEGGAARVLSLGGVSVVLPDSTAVIDLYSQGFASALVYRESAGVISFSPEYNFNKIFFWTESEVYRMGPMDSKGNNFIFWMTPFDAISIQVLYGGIFSDNYGLSGKFSMNRGTIKADYAHSFGTGIAMGLKFGYMAGYMENTGFEFWEYDGIHVYNSAGETSKYLECMIDMSIQLGAETALFISGGVMQPRGGMINPGKIIDQIPGFKFPVSDGMAGTYGSGVITGDGVEASYEYTTAGNALNAGLQYVMISVVEAFIKAGVVINYKEEYRHVRTWNSDFYLITNDGIAYDTAAKARFFLGGNFIAGLGAWGRAVDYKEIVKNGAGIINNMEKTDYSSELCAGLTYQNGIIRMPVEIFGYFSDRNYIFDRSGGLRGGVELDAAEWLSIRIGANVPFITEHVKDIKMNYVYEACAGVGFKFGEFNANCGFSYFARSYTFDLGYSYYDESKESNIRVMLDLTCML